MASNWSPPAQGRHLFVVLRHDDHVADRLQAISGTMAYVERHRAEAEAARLNDLNGAKGAKYFVCVVRLQPEAGG